MTTKHKRRRHFSLSLSFILKKPTKHYFNRLRKVPFSLFFLRPGVSLQSMECLWYIYRYPPSLKKKGCPLCKRNCVTLFSFTRRPEVNQDPSFESFEGHGTEAQDGAPWPAMKLSQKRAVAKAQQHCQAPEVNTLAAKVQGSKNHERNHEHEPYRSHRFSVLQHISWISLFFKKKISD